MKKPSLLIVFVLLWASAGYAQEPAAGELPPETATRFDLELMEIAARKDDIDRLTERAEGMEGVMAEVLLDRRDKLWVSMLRDTIRLAGEVVSEAEAGRDVSAYREPLTAGLNNLPSQMQGMLNRLEERVGMPLDEGDVHLLVIADQEFFQEIDRLHNLFQGIIEFVDVADFFGIDPAAEREFVSNGVAENAANLSAFLAIAQEDADTLKATTETLPENTQVADLLSAANERVRLASKALQNAVELMEPLGLESRAYRQQLLSVTGEITADVLDVGIVGGLLSDWGQAAKELLRDDGMQLMFRLLLVALILLVFWQLGKLVQRVFDTALSSSRVRMSALLKKMVLSTARNIVFFIGILIALGQFGISLGPVLAGLGIAGFILGFALQDTLSNFASGLMILFYRPFDVGDLVEAGGVSGKVSHMSLVNTTFMTLDNQRLVVPNNMIWQDVIKNVTAQHVRRIDLVFGVSYSDDLDKVESVLNEIVAAHDRVLDSPEPTIKMHELADSSVNFIVRPWVKTEDYWDTYWDLMKAVKLRFDAEGISIPFPQRDVHMIAPDPA